MLGKFIGIGQEEEEEEEEDEDERKQIIPYEEKYLEKYLNTEKIEIDSDTLDKFKNSILFENTPQGNVLMFYDNSRKSFVYYADKSIPYKFLESVGMRYVTTFNCSCIFYDMQEEIKLAEEKTLEKRKEKEQQKIVEQNTAANAKTSVFAKFKKYNNASTTKTTIKIVDDTLVVKENANRYSYEGKLSNYSFLKFPKKTETLSYADFKKISRTSNE